MVLVCYKQPSNVFVLTVLRVRFYNINNNKLGSGIGLYSRHSIAAPQLRTGLLASRELFRPNY